MAGAKREPTAQQKVMDAATTLHGLMRACDSAVGLEILALLMSGPKDVSTIARATELDLAHVSRRLSWMRLNDLAEGSVEGNRRVHALARRATIVREDGVCSVRFAVRGGGVLSIGFPQALVDALAAAIGQDAGGEAGVRVRPVRPSGRGARPPGGTRPVGVGYGAPSGEL